MKKYLFLFLIVAALFAVGSLEVSADVCSGTLVEDCRYSTEESCDAADGCSWYGGLGCLGLGCDFTWDEATCNSRYVCYYDSGPSGNTCDACVYNFGCSVGASCDVPTCSDADSDGYDDCAIGDPGDDGNQVDCNDGDGTIYVDRTGYPDADDDGYYSSSSSQICSGASLPSGYSDSAGNDCDEGDATKWRTNTFYTDSDGDGKGTGAGSSICYGSTIPNGYATTNTDCDDGDASVWQTKTLYDDNDGDGRGAGASGSVCMGSSLPSGKSYYGNDCDDTDASIYYMDMVFTGDNDGDGYGSTPENQCTGPGLDSGSPSIDCNDNDAEGWVYKTYYQDTDGDGYTGGQTSLCKDAAPEGYTTTNENDCDDTDGTVWIEKTIYQDADGDSYIGTSSVECVGDSLPEGWQEELDTDWDCNDEDSEVWEEITETGTYQTTSCTNTYNENTDSFDYVCTTKTSSYEYTYCPGSTPPKPPSGGGGGGGDGNPGGGPSGGVPGFDYGLQCTEAVPMCSDSVTYSSASYLVNEGPTFSAHARMEVQRYNSTDWEFQDLIYNSTVNASRLEEIDVSQLWKQGGNWNSTGAIGGSYRVRLVIQGLNGTPLALDNGSLAESFAPFTITGGEETTTPNATNIMPANHTIYNVSTAVNFSMNAVDDTGISSVVLALTLPNGTLESLTLGGSNPYNITYTLPIAGQYNGTYTVTDLAANTNVTDITFNATGFVVQNLDASLSVLDEPTSTVNFKTVAQFGRKRSALKKGTDVIAKLNVNLTENRNWVNVDADLENKTKYRQKYGSSFAHFPTGTGVDNITLFIPVTQDTGLVYVCPNAEKLSDVNETCPGKYFEWVTSSNNQYQINVTGTGAAESENSSLVIWDINDTEGGNQQAYTGSKVTFWANYTNITSNVSIPSAYCEWNSNATNELVNMSDVGTYFEHNVTFTDTFVTWNVSCSGNADFAALTAFDNVTLEEASVDPFLLTSCGNLSSPGTYNLTQDVSSAGTCFNITSSDVILDGKGYLVNYSESAYGFGVDVLAFDNVTTKALHITKGGATANSHAIRYYSNAANGSILNNTIDIPVGSNADSIEVNNAQEILVANNSINVTGSGGGIVAKSGSLNITISDNTINATGSEAIILDTNVNNSLVNNNVLHTAGIASSGDGVSLVSGSSFNIILSNNMTITGSSASGINLGPSTTDNNASYNKILATGSSTIAIDILDDNNVIVDNSIFDSGDHGIRVRDGEGNLLERNYINDTTRGIYLSTGQINPTVIINTVRNNTFNASVSEDIKIDSVLEGTKFIDQEATNYDFSTATFSFNDTMYGYVDFYKKATRSGSALYGVLNADIVFNNASAYFSYATPANITLYGVGERGHTTPTILRNGSECNNDTTPSCTNYTSLTAETVLFNVSDKGNYSIGELPVDPFLVNSCRNISSPGMYNLTQDISSTGNCINITSSNVTFDGNNSYGISYTGNSAKGIYVLSSENVTVQNIDVTQTGTPTSAYGIWYVRSHNGQVINTTVTTQTGNDGTGIFIDNSNETRVVGNDVITNGVGAMALNLNASNNVNASLNELDTTAANAIGLYVFQSGRNKLYNNTITTQDNTLASTSFGIRIQSFTYDSHSNVIFNNTLSTQSNPDAIRVESTDTYNNTFSSNIIVDSGQNHVRISSSALNGTKIVDQQVKGFQFAGSHDLEVENTTYGKVYFKNVGSSSGTNFVGNDTSNLVFGSAALNITGYSQFNQPMNITFYNTDSLGISEKVVVRNGSVCEEPECYTITDADTYVFNSTQYGLFTIHEADPFLLTSCKNLTTPGTYNLTTNIVTTDTCFNVTAHNVIIDGKGFSIDGDLEVNDDGVEVWSVENTTVKNILIYDFGRGVHLRSAHGSTITNITINRTASDSIRLLSTQNTSISLAVLNDSAGYGINFESSPNNVVANNTLVESGDSTTNEAGIRPDTSSGYLVIENNTIDGAAEHGMYLVSGNNNISYNTIKNTEERGVDLVGSATNTRFVNNTFVNIGSVAVQVGTDDNVFINTTISGSNFGFRFDNNADNTLIRGGTVSSSRDAVWFSGTNSKRNNITDVTLNSAVNFTVENNNGTTFIDGNVGAYGFVNGGGRIGVENTSFGNLFFTSRVYGNGTNLSRDIVVGNASLNISLSENVGLNASANVTFYSTDSLGLSDRTIYKNGSACSECYEFQDADTYIFNISEAGYYTLEEASVDPFLLTSCGNLSSPGVYNLTQDVSSVGTCFQIQSDDVVLDGKNYFINYSTSALLGYGVNNTGYDNMSVKNFSLYQGSSAANANGVYVEGSLNVLVDSLTASLSNIGSVGVDFLDTNLSEIRNSNLTSYAYPIRIRGSENVSVSNTNVTSTQGHALYVSGTTNSTFTRNQIFSSGDSVDDTAFLVLNADQNMISENNINFSSSTSSGPAIKIDDASFNILLNNNLTGSQGAITDLTGSSNTYLVYNNSFGEIRWIEGSFENNIDVLENITFDGNVEIRSNSVQWNSTLANSWNSSANITVHNTNALGLTDKYPYKDGAACDEPTCYELEDADTYVFNVTNAGNYSVGEAPVADPLLLTSCGTIDSPGYYNLTENLTAIGTCLEVESDDVTVDGKSLIINYSTTQTGYAINATSSNDNITIKNLIIYEGNSSADAYALDFAYVMNGTIKDNIIKTYGESSRGIVLAPSSNENNVIFNNITTYGTGGHALYYAGGKDTVIENNIVHTLGSSGYGVWINAGANTTTVKYNNITTNGSSGHGITLQQSSFFNQVLNNSVVTAGNSAYGIHVASSSDSNEVSQNNITSSNKGVYFTSAANLTATLNYINASSTGMDLSTVEDVNASFNTVERSVGMGLNVQSSRGVNASENFINSSGFGIYHGSSANNTFAYNLVDSGGNYGVSFVGSRNSTFNNNNITANTWGLNIATGSRSNSFSNNIINASLFSSSYSAITLQVASTFDNTITSNVILDNGRTELSWSEFGINGTRLVDQLIRNYTLAGNVFSVENTTLGKTVFTSAIAADGLLLYGYPNADIQFESSVVNISDRLNASANITFYNTDAQGLTDRHPYKDGTKCAAPDCTELSDADTYIFNITEAGYYTLGEAVVADTSTPNVTDLRENPVDGTTYVPNKKYEFNATVTDDENVDIVLFEINNTNYTTTKTGDVYNATVYDLAADTYIYRWYSNDTSSNRNDSETGTYTVNAAGTILNLSINGSQENLSFTYGDVVNITAEHENGTLQLLRNGTDIVSENGTHVSLASGYYNITAILTTTANYTPDRTETFFINVTQTTSACTLTSNSPVTYPAGITVSGTCTSPESPILHRENVDVSGENDTEVFLGAGTYNYTLNVTENENYTFTQDSILVTMNQNTDACDISVNDTSPATYPVDIKVWTNCEDFTLFRNASMITNNSVQTLGAGTYNFSVNRSDTQNYSNTYDDMIFVMQQGTPALSLEADPSWTETSGTETSITGASCPNELDCTLYRDNSPVSNPDTQTLGIGTHEYVYNTTGNENYSAATTTQTLTVTAKTAPTLELTFDVDSPQTYGTAITASCTTNSDGTLHLYRNDTQVTGELDSTIELAAGDWNYVCNVTETGTYAYKQDSQVYTIEKVPHNLSVFIGGEDANVTQTYGVSTTLKANSTTGTAMLEKEGISVSNPHTTVLAAGTHNYTGLVAENENYTTVNASHLLTITEASTELSLLINGTQNNLAMQEGNVNVTVNGANGTITLTRNGNNILGENSSIAAYGAGEYNISATLTADNNHSPNRQINLTINVTTAPNLIAPNVTTLTEIPTDGITYTPTTKYEFNATIIDDIAVDTVLFEFDNTNYTPTQTGNIYNMTFIGVNVGTYNYKWYANDSSGNVNDTETGTYTINTATTALNLTLNNSNENLSYTYGSQINIAVNGANGTVTLTRNGTNILSQNNSLTTLPAGHWNITATLSTTANYDPDRTETLFVNVSQAQPNISVFVDNQATDTSQGYGPTTTAKANSTTSATQLYKNGILVTNPETTTLIPGTYNYTAEAVENNNYTTDNASLLLTITPASTNLSLTLNGTFQNLTTGNNSVTNITAEGQNGTILLYRNGTDITNQNGTHIQLPTGYYNITAILTAADHHSPNRTETLFLNVTAVDTTPPTASNLLPEAGTTYNVSTPIPIGLTSVDAQNVSVNITLPNGTIYPFNLTEYTNIFNMSYTIPAVEGNYSIRYIMNDSFGNVNDTEINNFSVVFPAASIELIAPGNDSRFLANSSVNFTANVTTNYNKQCRLYTENSSSFTVTQDYVNFTGNQINFTANITSTGTQLWNVECAVGSTTSFAEENLTYKTFNASFVFDITSPTNGSTITADSVVNAQVLATGLFNASTITANLSFPSNSSFHVLTDQNNDETFNFTFIPSINGVYNLTVFGNNTEGEKKNQTINFTVEEGEEAPSSGGGGSSAPEEVPECSVDNDCSDSGYVGSASCEELNVVQTYSEGVCSSDSCSQDTYEVVRETCDFACEDGQCIDAACTADNDCTDVGFTSEAYCSGNDVVREYSAGICSEGSCAAETNVQTIETCEVSCSEGSCLECVSDSDCSDAQICNENNNCELIPLTCTPDWECSSWSACSGGIETRDCDDLNRCKDASGRPSETKSCSTGINETNPFFTVNETQTGSELVPCSDSISGLNINVRKDAPLIKLPWGREVVADPFEVTCTAGEEVDLTIVVPYAYTEYQVHTCKDGNCNEVSATPVDQLLCEKGLIEKASRVTTVYEPEAASLAVPRTVHQISGMQALPAGENTLVVNGTATVATQSPREAIPQPANPSLLLAGSPLQVEVNGTVNAEITLHYKDISNIEENTMRVYSYDGSAWTFVGGKPDKTENTVTATFNNLTGKHIFAAGGVYCTNCAGTTLEKVYEATSDTAVVLVHGFDSGPASFQAFVNDISLTKQPVDVWVAGYPMNTSMENVVKEYNELMEARMSTYQNVIIVSHSLGGIVTQAGARAAAENDLNYVNHVTDMILLGVPNQGLPSLGSFEHLFGTAINAKSLFRVFDIDSEILNDLPEYTNIPRVSGIEYRVIAGAKPYEIRVGPATVRSDRLLNLLGLNDGLLTTENARNVGGEVVSDVCKSYWELDLTHTELNDAEPARRLLGLVLAERIGVEETSLGSNQYVKVFLPSCEPGTTIYVSGKVKQTADLNELDACFSEEVLRVNSCYDGIKNANEEGVDCGGVCGACTKDYLFYFLLMFALAFFIYFAGREVGHVIQERSGTAQYRMRHMKKDVKHLRKNLRRIKK